MPPGTHEPEAMFLRFGTVAASAAGAAGFVYVVGGAVMWLRFWRSGLPADQALALVPRSDLLVVGMRIMILPALAAGGLFLLLAARRSRRPEGAQVTRTAVALLAVPALVLALVVPFAPGAYAWPLAALGLWYVWCHCLRAQDGAPQALVRRAVVAAMLAAALVSIARQFDRPVQLPSATLTVAGAQEPVTGVLVTVTSDAVVIGMPETARLTSFPRDRIETVDVGPPLDRRSPQRSLLSMAIGGDAWAATPLELWCGGESYGWTDLGTLCRTQPRLASATGRFAAGNVTVAVRCPAAADRGCSGFLALTTEQAFALDEPGRAAPVELGRTVFQLERDTRLDVALPVAAAPLRCLGAADQPVPLRAVLSSDRSSLGALNGDAGERVLVRFPPQSADSGCEEQPIVPSTVESLPAAPPARGGPLVLPAQNGPGEP